LFCLGRLPSASSAANLTRSTNCSNSVCVKKLCCAWCLWQQTCLHVGHTAFRWSPPSGDKQACACQHM
jgi:hypothetical protein